MKRLIILTAAISLGLYSCGKEITEKKPVTPNQQTTQQQQNTQQQTQQQQTQQQQTQQQQNNTTAGSSIHVNSVGSGAGKNESVDFTWQENGKQMKLSDYKGKVVLLNFWATWCGPCRKELPSLSEISTEMKGKDFKMIGVSVDEQQGAVDNFLKANALSYTILHEPNELVMKYMSASGQPDNVIPQTYLIDKKGKIVEIIVGGRSKEEFVKLINKYL